MLCSLTKSVYSAKNSYLPRLHRRRNSEEIDDDNSRQLVEYRSHDIDEINHTDNAINMKDFDEIDSRFFEVDASSGDQALSGQCCYRHGNNDVYDRDDVIVALVSAVYNLTAGDHNTNSSRFVEPLLAFHARLRQQSNAPSPSPPPRETSMGNAMEVDGQKAASRANTAARQYPCDTVSRMITRLVTYCYTRHCKLYPSLRDTSYAYLPSPADNSSNSTAPYSSRLFERSQDPMRIYKVILRHFDSTEWLPWEARIFRDFRFCLTACFSSLASRCYLSSYLTSPSIGAYNSSTDNSTSSVYSNYDSSSDVYSDVSSPSSLDCSPSFQSNSQPQDPAHCSTSIPGLLSFITSVDFASFYNFIDYPKFHSLDDSETVEFGFIDDLDGFAECLGDVALLQKTLYSLSHPAKWPKRKQPVKQSRIILDDDCVTEGAVGGDLNKACKVKYDIMRIDTKRKRNCKFVKQEAISGDKLDRIILDKAELKNFNDINNKEELRNKTANQCPCGIIYDGMLLYTYSTEMSSSRRQLCREVFLIPSMPPKWCCADDLAWPTLAAKLLQEESDAKFFFDLIARFGERSGGDVPGVKRNVKSDSDPKGCGDIDAGEFAEGNIFATVKVNSNTDESENAPVFINTKEHKGTYKTDERSSDYEMIDKEVHCNIVSCLLDTVINAPLPAVNALFDQLDSRIANSSLDLQKCLLNQLIWPLVTRCRGDDKLTYRALLLLPHLGPEVDELKYTMNRALQCCLTCSLAATKAISIQLQNQQAGLI